MSSPSDTRPKAVVEGYAPAPFFFAQTSPDGAVRLVAWAPEVRPVEALLHAVLAEFSPHAQVLLKVGKQDVPDGPVWTRYHGEAPTARVAKAVRDFERLVFHDGYTQLCVRDDDTGEYLALDEFGLLWVYSDDPKFADLCRACGFEERVEELISDRPRWQCALDDGPELAERFVRELGLNEVE